MSTRVGGGQPGKLNALRNGSRVDIRRLTIGDMPPQLRRCMYVARHYRRDLEAAVVERHGEVSILHAHSIDAAVGHETHAAVCRWLLRERLDSMTTADVLACSRAIASAKAERNRAVRELGLDPATGLSVVDALYDTPDASTDPGDDSDAGTDPDAADGHSDDLGGCDHDSA